MKGQRKLQPVNTFRWECTVNLRLADSKDRDWDWITVNSKIGLKITILLASTRGGFTVVFILFSNIVWNLLVKKSCGWLSVSCTINRLINQSDRQTVSQSVSQTFKSNQINQWSTSKIIYHSVNYKRMMVIWFICLPTP